MSRRCGLGELTTSRRPENVGARVGCWQRSERAPRYGDRHTSLALTELIAGHRRLADTSFRSLPLRPKSTVS